MTFNLVHHESNVYLDVKAYANKPSLVTGTIPELSHKTDTVEISPAARQLAASDIVNHAAKYFGTAQINDSLNHLLEDQPSEVKDAVYGMIQSNFITDGRVTNEEEQTALLDLGFSQARYIADNYMKNDGAAAKFMETIQQIGAIAKTRTLDPETGKINYDTPPQKPIGAPEDYIKTTDLMRKFEPDTLGKLQEAITSGKDWANILTTFAKKVPTHQEWVREYREETNKRMEKMHQNVNGNKFQNASTANLNDFAKGMKDLIANAGFKNTGFMTDNLDAFIRTIKGTNMI